MKLNQNKTKLVLSPSGARLFPIDTLHIECTIKVHLFFGELNHLQKFNDEMDRVYNVNFDVFILQ